MSIYYITGKPRSGKSFYAVYKINDFLTSKQYALVLTNIAGFKFDKYPSTRKTDFENFFDVYLKTLYQKYKQFKKDFDDYDSKLINVLKEDGYLHLDYDSSVTNSPLKTVFVVDECQAYLDNNHVHKKWFMTYHGHMGFDLYFITQALAQVAPVYKHTVEHVTNAVSNTWRFTDKYFTYQLYASTKMSRLDKMNTFRVLSSQKIFDMYKSGDKIKIKSFLLPKVFFILFLLFLVYFGYRYFLTSISPESTKTTILPTNLSGSPPAAIKKKELIVSNTFLVTVKCIDSICDSAYFSKIPYSVFKLGRGSKYFLLDFKESPYHLDIYIEMTEEGVSYYQGSKKEKSISSDVVDILN